MSRRTRKKPSRVGFSATSVSSSGPPPRIPPAAASAAKNAADDGSAGTSIWNAASSDAGSSDASSPDDRISMPSAASIRSV